MMKKDSVADPVMETLLNRYPGLASCAEEITEAYQILRNSIGQGGTVFVCGNGGSHADADHIIGELSKGFLSKRTVPAEIASRIT